jgi:hypothetical protein
MHLVVSWVTWHEYLSLVALKDKGESLCELLGNW